jgi:hypothetical protein
MKAASRPLFHLAKGEENIELAFYLVQINRFSLLAFCLLPGLDCW